jgi:hypothetical protein
MTLPRSAREHFAKNRLQSAYDHLTAVQEQYFKEGQEDRREFQKFYNNLALFSGGTIALSITFLGYLKTLGKPLRYQKLLTASWLALFLCLLCSLVYILVNLYYAFHFREAEYAKANKKKFEAELKEFPELDLANLQTSQEVAEFENPRKEALKTYGDRAERHEKKGNRYFRLWQWAGRVALLGFATGIGLLLWFAILNT